MPFSVWVKVMNSSVMAMTSSESNSNHGLFEARLKHLSSEDLLHYFQNRQCVEFFAHEDSHETSDAKMQSILCNIFEFNGETHAFGLNVDWKTNPSDDIEWHIMLHKFYYAVGLGRRFQETGDRRYADQWIALCSSWMEQTPVGFIAADVTGRRVQNWVYAYHYFVHQHPETPIPSGFHYDYLRSLARQVRFLCNNLHPARNHRTLELYAIFLVAVVFPEFSNSRVWLSFALDEIIRNIEVDLLDDGVQCELSTDYHHIVLRNYLYIRRLSQLNAIPFPASADKKLIKALEYAMYVHKPDGLVPSLSDGDVHSYQDILALGAEIYDRDDMLFVTTGGTQGTPPKARFAHFNESGYYLLRSDWINPQEQYQDARYAIFDCGPLGAGNHGHLDLLNFEAAAYGHSLIVDPGRYTYNENGETNWRVKFRGTAYHNTVQVDGINQTRYAMGKTKFKIKGPAPQHELLGAVHLSDYDLLAGRAISDEYDAIHQRHLHFIDQRYWVCIDHLDAECEHRYDLRFHLNHQANENTRLYCDAKGSTVVSPKLMLISPDSRNQVSVDSGFVSSRYGEKRAAPVIRYQLNTCNGSFYTVLMPYQDTPPNIKVSTLPVHCLSESGISDNERPLLHAAVIIRNLDDDSTDLCFSAAGLTQGRWLIGEWVLQGACLFVRKNAAGDIIKLRTDPLAQIFTLG